eukprot:TRINITY_DN11011_c0_g1_i2.p1 TRINITY_DN11011_c0_g1~~TRINITY_DN11011_c0_g1_i2.p1  ORF type:complete len:290 (+),score=92.88 TRINITY_DN11011_c0_g1_i2:191-1060(+)
MKTDMKAATKMVKGLLTRHAAAGGAEAVELLTMLHEATRELLLHTRAVESVNSWMLKMKSLGEQAKADTKLLLDTFKIEEQRIVEDDGNYSMETCTSFLDGAVSMRHLYRRVPVDGGRVQMMYTVSFLLPGEDASWCRICGARVIEQNMTCEGEDQRECQVALDVEEMVNLHHALAPSLPLIAFLKVLVSMQFFEEGSDMDKAVIAQAKEDRISADQVGQKEEDASPEEQTADEEPSTPSKEEPEPAEVPLGGADVLSPEEVAAQCEAFSAQLLAEDDAPEVVHDIDNM